MAAAEGNCILGGDFNLVLDPSLDRSDPKNNTRSKSATELSKGIKELGFTDIWRMCNPQQKDFSFYSNVHNVYSRTDMFIISQTLVPNIKSCSYLAATLSDYNALQMEVFL